MPFFLLLLISVLAGLGAAFLTRRYPGGATAPAVVEVAREAGEHATAATGRRAVRAARRDPEKATGLALTLALLVVLAGGVVLALLAVILGDKLLTHAIKELVDRARPELEAVAATLGPSFPSGHTSTAAASWAAFALVAGRWWGRRAWPALAGGAVGIAVAVALSRVLLDVHWLTDVLGGLALGWAWFAACAIAFGGRLLSFGASARAAARGGAEAASIKNLSG